MRVDAGWSICLALMLAVMHGGVATAEPQIVWQVENPFRFFLDPADTQVHRATWLSLSEVERKHPERASYESSHVPSTPRSMSFSGASRRSASHAPPR